MLRTNVECDMRRDSTAVVDTRVVVGAAIIICLSIEPIEPTTKGKRTSEQGGQRTPFETKTELDLVLNTQPRPGRRCGECACQRFLRTAQLTVWRGIACLVYISRSLLSGGVCV